ncbi:MAG: hypothetical protein GTN80_06475 [Nitrososphaeria archaeon]|nr:hypothetical protein [Nitrososphaeria archaeon]NIQ33272.1 hypothetical protein [Nitrososphaeria archaeon]
MLEHNTQKARSTPSNLAKNRARVYHLLSLLYIRPPDKALLKTLKSWIHAVIESLRVYESLPNHMSKGLNSMYIFLEDMDDRSLEFLSVEFTRLFRGLKPSKSPLPPYESLYRGEKLVFGETTIEVYKKYRYFNLIPVDRFKGDPPDHIAFELDFMRFLCSKEGEAWNKGDRNEVLKLLNAERNFVREHLIKWIRKLCEKIKLFDATGFYKALADLTEGWIDIDHEQITTCIEAMKYGIDNLS